MLIDAHALKSVHRLYMYKHKTNTSKKKNNRSPILSFYPTCIRVFPEYPLAFAGISPSSDCVPTAS